MGSRPAVAGLVVVGSTADDVATEKNRCVAVVVVEEKSRRAAAVVVKESKSAPGGLVPGVAACTALAAKGVIRYMNVVYHCNHRVVDSTGYAILWTR